MALVNTWILYSAQNDKSITHTEFLEKILHEALNQFTVDEESQQTKPVSPLVPSVENTPIDVTQRTHHYVKTCGQCTQCFHCKHKRKSNTTLYCSHCEVPLHLKCFQDYHEQRFRQ